MKTDFSEYLKTHEQYKTLCVSTGDIAESDHELLNDMALEGGMVVQRDFGWFVKLYDEIEYNETAFRMASSAFISLMEAALEAGFRMIEIDCDAESTNEWYLD